MKNCLLIFIGLFCFLTTVLAQPANDDPCNAKIILPTQVVCNAYEDNSVNSTTSLMAATVTNGFGVVDYNCDYNTTPDLYDVWFKIPLDTLNMIIKVNPIPGFDIAFQLYYQQSGSCSSNDLSLGFFDCINISSAGVSDSVVIPYYYRSYFDTLFIRVYHHPDGIGPAPINNSQFSICGYYPPPTCTTNTFPADGEQLLGFTYLQWNPNSFATYYDVYLGNTVATASVIGRTASLSFNILSLNLPAGTYYWYVVPMNGLVAATGCSLSATSFTILETTANNLICNATELFASAISCTSFIDNSAFSTTSYYYSSFEGGIFGDGVNCNSTSFLNADVWFKFTAPDSAYYVFRVEPVAGINTSFRVFESSTACAGSFTNRGCSNTGITAGVDTASILLNPGKQYFIQVFSQNGSRDFNPPGNSQFGICIYKREPDCVSPLLVAPANGSTTVDHITGSLSWKYVNGASRYDLYVGTSVGNMQLVNSTSPQKVFDEMRLRFQNDFLKGSPFFPGIQYFWKVIPVNGDIVNVSCSEEIRSFTTYACPPSLSNVSALISANRAGELDYSVPCLNCPSSWLVFEYGPNSIAGTGTTPAVGNTVVYPVAETLPLGYKGRVGIDSTHEIPSYKYFIRATACPNLSGAYLAFNPGNVQSLTVCSTTEITLENGKGRWNFNGQYPVNSNGKATPGKMAWFNFTPTESAVYYLQTDSVEVTDSINYLYKVDSLNKYSSDNWIGIGAINKKGKFPIGFLTAGLTYHFVADSENDSLLNRTTALAWQKRHFIKICKADVLSAPVTNTCIEANIYNPLPALSPKEEFAIDTSGRLIASIKPGNDSLGFIAVSYYVNSNGLRFDASGREYLDRNYTITPSNNPVAVQNVKLFFTNEELTALINAPDDGKGDVNSINDLVVTKTNQPCSTSSNVGSLGNIFIHPTDKGIYNSNSNFITIPVNSFSTFYLHGGSLVALPLKFLSFTAQKENSKVDLKWITDNEINTSHFVVERSFAGALFNSIGTVTSANTSGLQEYDFGDYSPENGINLYRIKQIDINGNYKYSEIRTVYFSNGSLVKVYPTITSTSITIYGLASDMSFNLFDMNGRSLIQGSLSIGSKELNISNYSKGLYLLKVANSNGTTQVFKILKE